VTDLIKIAASQLASNEANYDRFIHLVKLTRYSDKISRKYIAGLMFRVADITFDGAFSQIRNSCPRLSDEDLGFCSMIVLGFSKGSIRMIFQQSNDQSYYNRRNKIYNKIGRYDKGSLDDYIRSVTEMLRKGESEI
jgi:hypothetical protein